MFTIQISFDQLNVLKDTDILLCLTVEQFAIYFASKPSRYSEIT